MDWLKQKGESMVDNTFWQDFSIADAFGPHAVEDTYKRASKGWEDNVEYYAALVVTLNHKIWQHWESGDKKLAELYDRLWKRADAYAYEHFGKDDLRRYWELTD